MWTSYPVREDSWLWRFADLLYPPSCAGCGAPAGGDDPYLCARCAVMIPWRDPVRCPSCEQPVARPRQWCLACQAIWPAAERIIALGYYGGALRRAIRVFKYGPVRGVGAWLAEMLARRVPREVGGIDCVVPVPGGRARRRTRGFDPAEVIAGPVARWLAVPLETGLVVRARDGTHHAGRARIDREIQVHDRFACTRPGALAGQRVLVVDDVYTTGATLECVTRLLKEEAGARNVVGAVLARAVSEGPPR